MSESANVTALAHRRLAWACRRGMRELDVLLDRYLQHDFPQALQPEKAAFEQLLTLPDPELARYLLAGVEPADNRIAAVVHKISPRR